MNVRLRVRLGAFQTDTPDWALSQPLTARRHTQQAEPRKQQVDIHQELRSFFQEHYQAGAPPTTRMSSPRTSVSWKH